MRQIVVAVLLAGLLLLGACAAPEPRVALEGNTLTIAVEGYEESCVDPYAVYFVGPDGRARKGSYLPYQGAYLLDDQYVDQEWQDEGCDVLGICDPFSERTIHLEEILYEFQGRTLHEPSGETVPAFSTLAPTEEIRVELNYFKDDECREPVTYETTLTRQP